jgi:hypothetical protein
MNTKTYGEAKAPADVLSGSLPAPPAFGELFGALDKAIAAASTPPPE